MKINEMMRIFDAFNDSHSDHRRITTIRYSIENDQILWCFFMNNRGVCWKYPKNLNTRELLPVKETTPFGAVVYMKYENLE